MYCKVIKGKVVFPPAVYKNIINPGKDPVWLQAHGFLDLTADQINEQKRKYNDMLEKAKSRQPKKYSKLKIIRTLGDEWSKYEQMLTQAGLMVQFNNSQYLRSDDPIFKKIVATLPKEVTARLDECIYDED